MAFLDELSKKLTDAGKVVVRKTREITDVSGLKLRIADENRKMTRLYENLGKEYFSLHQEHPQEELEGLVKQLKSSMERVSALEAEIEKVEAESRAKAEEEKRQRAWEAAGRDESVMDAESREVHQEAEPEAGKKEEAREEAETEEQAEAEKKAETQAEAEPEEKAEAQEEAETEEKAEAQEEVELEEQAEVEAEVETEKKAETQAEAEPEEKAEA